MDDFAVLAPYLVSNGYCVYSTTYGATVLGPVIAGLGPMETSAITLSDFVDRVLTSTGADKVDIVGHSEGTTVPAYYMKFLGGAAKVDRFVGFGANYFGTSLSGLGTLAGALHFQPLLDSGGCQACSEFLAGSSFLQSLDAGDVAVLGPHYTNIVTRYDAVVTPYTSGILHEAGVDNVVLQDACPLDFSGHIGLAADPNVLSLVRFKLDPGKASAPTCTPYWALGA